MTFSTAHSDADGRNVRGGASLCGFGYGYSLTCLRVRDNVAVLVFPTGLRGPSHFTLRLTDNGASPDKLEADTQWSDCSDLSLLDFEDTGFEGELTVIDAP